jgi:hypothetical protein
VPCSATYVWLTCFSGSNQFLEDNNLRDFLDRHLPQTYKGQVYGDLGISRSRVCADASSLEGFGWRVVRDIWDLHKEGNLQIPTLKRVDGFGRCLLAVRHGSGSSGMLIPSTSITHGTS